MSGAPRLALAALLLAGCGEPEPPAPPPPAPAAEAPRPEVRFVDLRGAATGFGPVGHTGSPLDKRWIADAKGGGMILLDYDLDGDLDVLAPDGDAVTGPPVPGARTRLFRNEGGLRFVEATEAARIDVTGPAFGGAAADYDADGDTDVFLGMLGPDRLLRNEGNGTFADAAREAGVEGGPRDMTTAACFADFDGDGWLDLHVANYVDMRRVIEEAAAKGSTGKDCAWRNLEVYCGPMGLPCQADRLFLSNGRDPATGKVTFRDATANLLGQEPRPSFQCVAADFDRDGDMDVFTSVDSRPNFLWINDGKGTFRDGAAEAGCAYSALVQSQACMGTDVGDYDHDGLLDIVVTNFSHDYNTLYRNRSVPAKGGRGPRVAFEDVSARTGISAPTHLLLCWVSAFTDFDNDGDEDAVLAVLDGEAYLLRNDGGNTAGWIRISLRGKRPLDPAGALVGVEAEGLLPQWDVAKRGNSFLSSSDPRLLFGLGKAARAARVTVAWPSGATSAFEGLEGRAHWLLEEGVPAAKRLPSPAGR